ncbi:hypothetical protein ACA910_001795 [Epithemia clementina (nom. ined.)]
MRMTDTISLFNSQTVETLTKDYITKSFTWVDYVITLLVLVFGSSWWWWYLVVGRRSRRHIPFDADNHAQQQEQQRQHDIPFFEPCPNPNCVRCQMYQQVNALAQRRLRMLRIHDTNDPAQRVINAVRKGPQEYYYNYDYSSPQDGDGETNTTTTATTTTEAPCEGQYPTVLLVPGLGVQPLVTEWHQPICDALERSAAEIWKEYQSVIANMANEKHGISSTTTTINTPMSPPPVPAAPIQSTSQQSLSSLSALPSQRSVVRFLENDAPNEGGRWQALHVLNQGIWQANVVPHFPTTIRILQPWMDSKQAPAQQRPRDTSRILADQNCVFGNILFSVLHPGTVIEPHCGPCNVRHRLHLTLQTGLTKHNKNNNITNGKNEDDETSDAIPTLYMQGLSAQQPWKVQGKAFVMDDSLVHAVSYHGKNKNKSNSSSEDDSEYRPRVVLIVDLWHPHLTLAERQLIAELYRNSNSRGNGGGGGESSSSRNLVDER